MVVLPLVNIARIPLYLKLRLAQSNFHALVLRGQQARRVNILDLIVRRR